MPGHSRLSRDITSLICAMAVCKCKGGVSSKRGASWRHVSRGLGASGQWWRPSSGYGGNEGHAVGRTASQARMKCPQHAPPALSCCTPQALWILCCGRTGGRGNTSVARQPRHTHHQAGLATPAGAPHMSSKHVALQLHIGSARLATLTERCRASFLWLCNSRPLCPSRRSQNSTPLLCKTTKHHRRVYNKKRLEYRLRTTKNCNGRGQASVQLRCLSL